MTTANKRDEAIVLGALPGILPDFASAFRRTRMLAAQSANLIYEDANAAMNRLERAGKIRYNRSAKVWEKCE
ncbi:hypothetical protein [Acetobacter cerevisiae]|nr:hypothetical protein [Acetobacter cerevisiae]